jgi:hypothetical protein
MINKTNEPFELPFGAVSCEKEMELLQNNYKDYFFDHAPFNKKALDKSLKRNN